MLIFLDTEFTDFIKIDLISVGLVTEDGREFYGERNDYRYEDCSDFVRTTVLPLLRRVSNARCSADHLTYRLQQWFASLAEPVTLVFDYSSDWELLAEALQGNTAQPLPANIGEKWLLRREVISDPIFQQAWQATYDADWQQHHALADARALRAGYLAWRMSSFD